MGVFVTVVVVILDASAVEVVTSRRLSADDFITEKVIGRGAFGEVQLVSFN